MTSKTPKRNKITLEILAGMVAQGFSEVRSEMATKDDIKILDGKISKLRADMEDMFEYYMGTFRKDFDGLAYRVKKIEEHLFSGKGR